MRRFDLDGLLQLKRSPCYGVMVPAIGLPGLASIEEPVPSCGRMRKWVTANETVCPTMKLQRRNSSLFMRERRISPSAVSISSRYATLKNKYGVA